MSYLFFFFLFTSLSTSLLANATIVPPTTQTLIKTFNDICFINREQIGEIPKIAKSLHWVESKNDTLEALNLKKFQYNDFTIIIENSMDRVFCSIGINNNNKEFGYNLIDSFINTFPPVGPVFNTNEYNISHQNLILLKKDVETNFIKEWFIVGGYEIVVSLSDLEYQQIGNLKNKYVSIQLSRF